MRAALFLQGTLRVGCALSRQCKAYDLQVSKMITRLSQSSINNDINAETYGQTRSLGTLRVGCALRDRREQS